MRMKVVLGGATIRASRVRESRAEQVRDEGPLRPGRQITSPMDAAPTGVVANRGHPRSVAVVRLSAICAGRTPLRQPALHRRHASDKAKLGTDGLAIYFSIPFFMKESPGSGELLWRLFANKRVRKHAAV